MSTPLQGPLHIVLLGPPASGKGTQGKALAASLSLGYLSTGALLREHVENRTELGQRAAPILARGEYLPDDLMCPILGDWLQKQTGGWVLDGFPRSLAQAEYLENWLNDHQQKLSAALSLEVPYDQLLTRIQGRVECPECRWSGQIAQLIDGQKCPVCGARASRRSDDDLENFRSRHREFVTNTRPVIDFYSKRGTLHTCDASSPQEVVAAKLKALLVAPEASA
ncbi:nucleoside monophosphate kinase [Luteolibacter pohnpeiensis]|uniref:Adenylate kinase n=1 Tax=Luteolibacter pohnpeiensis TaxID=454153 RepID=A0A934S8L2_9BACT|nr:nucleoside monophosphate kinase [Luteolibacter pohnpeiensis]MBK1882841.1 nucleoside monophosphate kinase [Luteolibacter pohnpeiensis]